MAKTYLARVGIFMINCSIFLIFCCFRRNGQPFNAPAPRPVNGAECL
jgi:hypothetical protein